MINTPQTNANKKNRHYIKYHKIINFINISDTTLIISTLPPLHSPPPLGFFQITSSLSSLRRISQLAAVACQSILESSLRPGDQRPTNGKKITPRCFFEESLLREGEFCGMNLLQNSTRIVTLTLAKNHMVLHLKNRGKGKGFGFLFGLGRPRAMLVLGRVVLTRNLDSCV